MVGFKITHFNQFAYVANAATPNHEDAVLSGCKNTISFDSDYLTITAMKEKKALCTISFDLTPQFTKEIKALAAVLEQTESDD
jgi:hypothetical protein